MPRSAFIGQQLETQLVGQSQPGHSITPDPLETRINAEGVEAQEAAETSATSAIAAAIAASEGTMHTYVGNAVNNGIAQALGVFNGNVFVNSAVFDEETVEVGDVVYLDATPAWSILDGTETFTDKNPVVGVVTSVEPKQVQIAGIVENVVFDTAGAWYVDASGAPTATPTNYLLGVCLAAGVLLLGAQTTTFAAE